MHRVLIQLQFSKFRINDEFAELVTKALLFFKLGQPLFIRLVNHFCITQKARAAGVLNRAG